MKAFRSGTYPPFNMALRIFFLVFPLFFIWVENAAAQAQVIIAPHESRVNEGEPVSLDITVLDVPQDGLNMAYRLVQYGNPQFRPARHVESIHHDSVFIPQGNQGTVTVSLETKADNFRENDYEIGFSILSLTGTESGEVLDAVCSTASEPYYFRTISAGCTEYITVRNQGWELQAPEIPSSMIYASLSAPPLVAPGALVPITARLSAPAPAFGMTVHFAMYETGSNFLADSLAPHSPRFIRHEIFIPPGQISMTRTYQLRHTDGIAQNCIARPESAVSGPARGCILVELAEPKGADGKPGPYGIYPTRAQVRPQEILVVDHAPEFPVAEPIPDNQTDRKAFTFLPVRTAESDTDVATADKAETQFTRSPAQSVKATETVKTVETEETDSGIDSVTENRTEAQPDKPARVVETPFVNSPGHNAEITAAAKDEVTKVAKDEMNAQAERINDVNQANSLAQLPDGNIGANGSAQQATSDMEFSRADSTRANRTMAVNPPEHETQMTEATKDEMNAQAERIDDELATGASVTGTSITEANVTGTSAVGANDIKNSDLPEIFIDDLTIGEHDGPVFFTISLSKTPVHEVQVNITTSDGSARQGEDYTAIQARAIFVPNGPLSLKLPVLILDDTDIESVETFIAQLSEAEYAVIAKKIGTVAIIDDDDTGQAKLLPQLSDGNTEVGENAQHAASGTEVSGAEVSRAGVSETEVSRADDAMSVNEFPSEIPASNDLAGKMVDHSPASPVMTADNPLISPAVTSTLQAEQPISQIPDAKNEPAETDTTDTINVTDTTGTTGTANLTNTINTTSVIAEKPDPGTQIGETPKLPETSIGETPKLPETSIGETPKLPEISINDITISEHEGQAVFVISLSRASRNTVSMNISTTDITATEMDDYIRVQTTLSFAPGEQTLEFTVPVNDDEMPEPGETFAVRLDTPAYAVIAKETGTGTIIDDDHPNEVDTVPEISINDVTMDENAEEAVFAISLSETVSDIVTVNAATRDGSAIHPDDYTGTSSAVTFMPGETVQQFRVPLVDNDIPEPDRTFAVVLDNASGATIAETGGTGRIIDDGDAIPGISISDAILSNDGTMALFSIFLSKPSGMTISVNAGTRDGTARQPDDYTGTLKEVTFAPGETVQQFNVPLMRNEIPWSAGTFTVELNGAVNAVIEGRTGQAFLAGDTGQAFLAGDTGQAFLAGDTGQAFLAGDDGHVAVEEQGGIADDDGHMAVEEQGSIADDDGHVAIEEQGGIADDDGHMAVEEQGSIADDIPQLSIDDVTISEHDQAAVFVISLSRVSAGPVTVRIETADGSAVYPEDYIRRIKYLEFQPGTLTQGFDIPLVDDNIPESDEMFTVHLSEPEGAVVMNETGTGTIIDNDDDFPDILSPDKSAPSNGDHADIDDRTNLGFGLEESAEPAESEKPATEIHSPDAPSGPSEKTERETSSGKIVRAIRVVNTDRPESSGSKQDTPIQTRNSVSRTNTIPSSGGRIHPGFLAGSAIAIHRFQHVLRDSPDTVPAGSKNSAPAGTRFSSGSVAGRFLLDRQRTVLSGMPGIVRFFRQRRRSPNGLWSEITGRRGQTPNGSNVHFAGNFGFHKIKSERFLYGVMLQLQSTSTGPQAHTGGISGRAWLAGPYFAARHRSLPIYLEGKLLFGESANTLEPGGNGMHYRQGKFNTSRILAQFRLETDIDLGILGGTLIPHADLRWIQDQAKPFTAIAENDSRHQAAGQIIRTGEFELGSGIEIPIATGRGEMLFNAAAGVILSRSKSSHAGESSTSRGRVSAGLQYRLDENTFYEFNTFLDGIALPEYQEYGISLTAEYRF